MATSKGSDNSKEKSKESGSEAGKESDGSPLLDAPNPDKRWFCNIQNKIQGPLTPQDIEGLVASHSDALIWGKGLAEWLAPEEWRVSLEHFRNQKSSVRAIRWKFRDGPRESELLTLEEAVQQLKLLPNYHGVQVWSESQPQWTDVFVVHEFVEGLGISRRQHQRVPIKGNIEFDEPEGLPPFRAVSISEGGLGLSESKNLNLGILIKGTLRSSNLSAPLKISAEVVFLGPDGYTGLRFKDMADEGRTIIVEYIKKFSDFQPIQ